VHANLAVRDGSAPSLELEPQAIGWVARVTPDVTFLACLTRRLEWRFILQILLINGDSETSKLTWDCGIYILA
jgi:hypothetical protein